MSGRAGGADRTEELLRAALTMTVGEVSPLTFRTLHVMVRKAGHVFSYGLLALLWFRALRGGRNDFRMSWAAGAFFMACAVAIADEWHQASIATRTGTYQDVLIDAVGAATALLIVALGNRSRRKESYSI